ncbi:NAD(P)H-dependent flavin oxidoreductase [Pseudonocardia sp. HH130630-07]|uniref:NAD(P)H-dependent flavin oxidoreductase n=1 Tax=Pseudonocardia sp. HH130630-07 TaxID=1690815 RepID=UPI000814F273|nr:nitronate monooxygenase family protein [Pseudonocardia sp. HH130630-07]ANY07568.1 2-nitropropane dioxygenase [Pseudonocardia sp. HH130630-07]
MALPPPLDTPLRVPVLAAPMFIVSGPELVAAQIRAGVIGSFPALNARPQSELGDWLAEIAGTAGTAAPYAVNLIVHRSNDRLDADLATVAEHRVPVVITSLGARAEVNEAVHAYGGLVLHDVTTDRFARKAVEKGADGLIAVAAGAGGHAGTLSPFALVREIRRWFDGPLALSGAIAHGASVLAAVAAGADLAYVGSAFLPTRECRAAAAYKDMVLGSSSADIVYTSRFSGVPANYLRGSIEAAGLDPVPATGTDPTLMDFGSAPDDRPGPRPWRDVWGAGQGIADVERAGTTAELVDRLAEEYDAALRGLGDRVPQGRDPAPTG